MINWLKSRVRALKIEVLATYLAGVIALVGWMLWSPSLPLIVAPFLFFTAAHLFVTLYEEPTLKKKFGAAYGEYCKRVPRWIPRFR